jgi:hypothetical protein
MEVEQILLTLGFTLLGAFITFAFAWYWYQKRIADEKAKEIAEAHKKLGEKVDDLENRLALLTQSVLPMNTAFQTILVRELTHYHEKRTDYLLEQLGPPNIISEAEEEELSNALEKRTHDMGEEIGQSEREAAIILPYIIKRVRAETKKIKQGKISEVDFVAIAEPNKSIVSPIEFPKEEKK